MDADQLVRATDAAAGRLAARGAVAQAKGVAFHCTYPDGHRVVVRNALQTVPTFSEVHVMDQVAYEIVRALFELHRPD